MYNPTQKNLLVAGAYASQSVNHLRMALNFDESRDEPELRPDLRRLLTDAEELSNRIQKLRQDYDDKKEG